MPDASNLSCAERTPPNVELKVPTDLIEEVEGVIKRRDRDFEYWTPF